MQKIIILGGTGFIGRHLHKMLVEDGYEVVVYGRRAFETNFNLTAQLEDKDILIMLAGENVGKRWSNRYKQALWDSRIETNKHLKFALQQCKNPPSRILVASAVGIYPQTDCEALLDESCTLKGEGFLADLARAWEQQTSQLGDDVLTMRFGVVLGNDGGALKKMLPAFQMGFGGPVAGGEQCFSWIHINDLIQAVAFVISRPDMQGVYNFTSPFPVSNEEFGRTLAKVLKRPFWLPMPEWQLRLMFGEASQLMTYSVGVYPSRLLDDGFRFHYGNLEQALNNLLVKKYRTLENN